MMLGFYPWSWQPRRTAWPIIIDYDPDEVCLWFDGSAGMIYTSGKESQSAISSALACDEAQQLSLALRFTSDEVDDHAPNRYDPPEAPPFADGGTEQPD